MTNYHDGFIDGLNDVKNQMQHLIDNAPISGRIMKPTKSRF
jgi:hypothetical protein